MPKLLLKGDFAVANKINLAFFNAYLELDEICAQRFEISKQGLTTYIKRLVELRFAPDRSEVLSQLIKYRKYRNTIAHEADALLEMTEITKEDIKWLNDFAKSVQKKRDPISRYERKAKRYAIWRKLRLALIALGVVVVAITGIVIYINLK